MRMFSAQQPVGLSAKFPRERSKPILPEVGMEHRPVGSLEFELELEIVGENTIERRLRTQANQNQPSFHAPKLEIPLFDGENPRWWVRQCERMFTLYQVPEQHMITLASAYLNDMGDAWLQGWIRVKEGSPWSVFADDLCERFGDGSMMDVIEEFNKRKQEGTVQTYQLKFEELRSLMMVHNPHLTEGYFVSSFISGLGDEVRSMVKMM